MTWGWRRLSLMRPVSRGGEPRSSITVTCRRANPQSAFWIRKRGNTWLGSCYLLNGFKWADQVKSHLCHDVLELVVRVRHVGCRHDQQPPLFIELIQESWRCLYIGFNLNCYKQKVIVTSSTYTPPYVQKHIQKHSVMYAVHSIL